MSQPPSPSPTAVFAAANSSTVAVHQDPPQYRPHHIPLVPFGCPPHLAYDESSLPRDAGQVYCNTSWDSVSCWPTTLAGNMSVINCPKEYGGYQIIAGNASRLCYENGTWEGRANYSKCLLDAFDKDDALHNYNVRVMYYIGFLTSLLACVVALFIFLYYRSLRCLRNTIHCHLILTFIFRNLLWLVMNSALPILGRPAEPTEPPNVVYEWLCRLIVATFNYMQITNFFWMLVEGLYLYVGIVWAFHADNIKLWHYAIVGWCVPVVVVVSWSVVKVNFENDACWLPKAGTYYDYVYIGPILGVLLANVFFLGSIVYVLITKLRASNSLQTRQYRKAARSTLILFPLLGVTYVLFLTPPTDVMVAERVFVYVNVILQSLQGLFVAVFYCFLNGEVTSTLKMRMSRWRESRSLSRRYSRGSIATGGEHIRLRASFGTAGETQLVSTSDTECNGRASISAKSDRSISSTSSQKALKNNNKQNFRRPATDRYYKAKYTCQEEAAL